VAGVPVDLAEQGAAEDVLARAHKRFGPVSLIINAIADPAVSSAALANESSGDTRVRSRLGSAIEPVHNVVRASLEVLQPHGGGTFIQITGGLALRARRGTAELAATGYATRALVEGSIADARDHGVHVALLVIRGLIQSDLTDQMLEGKAPEASMVDADVIAAIDFLLAQTRLRAWTHELTLTPAKAAWLD
jgi:NADP-dependent 3-hydroxy acid dehydrogenase YdfG